MILLIEIDLIPEINREFNYFSSFLHKLENISMDETVLEFNGMLFRDKSFITFVNYNIRSFAANADQFFCQSENGNIPHVITLTETWFADDNIEEIPGYHYFHAIHPHRRSGGVSIYISEFIIAEGIHFELYMKKINAITLIKYLI